MSKTRLASGIGDVLAADLALAFLHDTLSTLSSVEGIVPVIATTDLTWDFGVDTERVDQGTGDLGARLERVLRDGLNHSGAAMVVGADSPGVPVALLEAARDALDTHDAVLLPSDDGGFVVLGVRVLPEGVLSGIPWSSANTRSEVVAALVREGLSVVCLTTWFDVDTPADLERFRREVPESRAPATWKVLRAHASRGESG